MDFNFLHKAWNACSRMEKVSHHRFVIRLFTLLVLSTLGLIFGLTNSAQAAGPVRIMPLGDSITYGGCSSDLSGYRRELCLSLAGYAVDFVGSLQTGPSDFDNDHEGHPSWHADEIRDNVYNWLVDNPADIVLLHIGTNDISTWQNASQIATEIGQILDEIDHYEDDNYVNIIVILARIINREDPMSQLGLVTTDLNPAKTDPSERGERCRGARPCAPTTVAVGCSNINKMPCM